MKLKQLINGGALAATVLTLGTAQADNYDGIVFCKATIVGSSETHVSVTLPYTASGSDGWQYTHWNVGRVAPGGVADSWHSEGGSGKFEAHNSGNVGVYVYLTSSKDSYHSHWFWDPTYGTCWEEFVNIGGRAFYEIFGDENIRIRPVTSLKHLGMSDDYYCLAFTRDMTGKIPTWNMLNRLYYHLPGSNVHYNGEWIDDVDEFELDQGLGNYCVGAYMGYLDAGDYMPFDVKFWAPRVYVESGSFITVNFTFKVEAATFPLWEHDIEVR